MLMVMKEHVTQSNGVVHVYVFNSFWTTIEVSGTGASSGYMFIGSILSLDL